VTLKLAQSVRCEESTVSPHTGLIFFLTRLLPDLPMFRPVPFPGRRS